MGLAAAEGAGTGVVDASGGGVTDCTSVLSRES